MSAFFLLSLVVKQKQHIKSMLAKALGAQDVGHLSFKILLFKIRAIQTFSLPLLNLIWSVHFERSSIRVLVSRLF